MRSAHDAIEEMREEGLRKGRRCHVVDCDLEAFFDTVDHQKLMGRLRQRITDPGLLALILKYLKAGAISRTGALRGALRGVPQGSRSARYWLISCSTSWTTNSKSEGTSS